MLGWGWCRSPSPWAFESARQLGLASARTGRSVYTGHPRHSDRTRSTVQCNSRRRSRTRRTRNRSRRSPRPHVSRSNRRRARRSASPLVSVHIRNSRRISRSPRTDRTHPMAPCSSRCRCHTHTPHTHCYRNLIHRARRSSRRRALGSASVYWSAAVARTSSYPRTGRRLCQSRRRPTSCRSTTNPRRTRTPGTLRSRNLDRRATNSNLPCRARMITPWAQPSLIDARRVAPLLPAGAAPPR